jgi:hypothetical protein
MNNPSRDQYDPANAAALCRASAAAYQTCDEGVTIRDIETDTIAQLSIINSQLSTDLIIAFRGTADLRNVLTDLDCELIRVGDFRVHRGFHAAIEAVEFDLDGSLGLKGEARLWVTRHSLGGALAKLFALWVVERGHPVAGVYTFGQPRVGDAAFAARYDSVLKPQTFRVVHADDMVPRLPWQFARYRHAGHEIFFPANYQLSIVNYQLDLPWPRKLLYDLPALARDLGRGRLALLDDHHVSRYLALFKEPRQETRVDCTCVF